MDSKFIFPFLLIAAQALSACKAEQQIASCERVAEIEATFEKLDLDFQPDALIRMSEEELSARDQHRSEAIEASVCDVISIDILTNRHPDRWLNSPGMHMDRIVIGWNDESSLKRFRDRTVRAVGDWGEPWGLANMYVRRHSFLVLREGEIELDYRGYRSSLARHESWYPAHIHITAEADPEGVDD